MHWSFVGPQLNNCATQTLIMVNFSKMDKAIQDLIAYYQLSPHPEGGYYRETYRSPLIHPQHTLPIAFSGPRHSATAIYFLLVQDSFSAFHRIQSDECWHFYEGASVDIHVLHSSGQYELIRLGSDWGNGERFQAMVPAGAWFASSTNGAYALVGCTVSPGFDFQDFELATASSLCEAYPNYEALIKRYCRD